MAEDKYKLGNELYSAIDANANRSLEGIRVCEDIFRFVVRNSSLASGLKEIRHNIKNALNILPFKNLITYRDVESDSQKYFDLKSEKTRNSITDLAGSNLHRAMEAMRSLEEFSKLLKVIPDNTENPFQRIRFSLYSMEKEIMQFLLKKDKHRYFINSLYAILDSAFVKNNEYTATASRLINGGASIIQLRMKNNPVREILAAAKEVAAVCKKHDVLFIINDYPEIACLSDADGVHLGQDDLPVRETRSIIPADMIIGISTHSIEQAIAASVDAPDYIAIGPVFDTSTKNGLELKGIGEAPVREVLLKIQIPLVCIGGLDPERIKLLKETGAGCFAVVSYLYKNDKIEENCRKTISSL